MQNNLARMENRSIHFLIGDLKIVHDVFFFLEGWLRERPLENYE